MFSLDSIQKTKHAAPPRIMLHGLEKIGKSTFFAGGPVGDRVQEGAPDPIFIRTEDGLSGLDTSAFPLAESYADVLQQLDVLLAEAHEFQTVVIDSADWLEKLIIESICDIDGSPSIEQAAGGYGKGYSMVVTEWSRVLRKLDHLNKSKNMIAGVICHSVITSYNDPEHEPYDIFRPKLYQSKSGKPGSCEMLQEWADVIGFAGRQMTIQHRKGADGKKVARGVELTSDSNVLHLKGTPAYIAGNRYGLPATLPLSWAAFRDALAASAQR